MKKIGESRGVPLKVDVKKEEGFSHDVKDCHREFDRNL